MGHHIHEKHLDCTNWHHQTQDMFAFAARDISCACEQQQGNIPSMFVVCNVDYIVDMSSSDRIAREHFRFF